MSPSQPRRSRCDRARNWRAILRTLRTYCQQSPNSLPSRRPEDEERARSRRHREGLDIALTTLVFLSAIVFLAYVGYFYLDYGLFKILPPSITDFFVNAGALQYVALAVFIVTLIGKVSLGRAIKRREAKSRI